MPKRKKIEINKELVRLAVQEVIRTTDKNNWGIRTIIELARLYETDKLKVNKT